MSVTSTGGLSRDAGVVPDNMAQPQVNNRKRGWMVGWMDGRGTFKKYNTTQAFFPTGRI